MCRVVVSDVEGAHGNLKWPQFNIRGNYKTSFLSDFGHGGQDGDDGLLKNASAIKVLLGVGFEAHAVALQSIKVLQRRAGAFAAEAVKALEQH